MTVVSKGLQYDTDQIPYLLWSFYYFLTEELK